MKKKDITFNDVKKLMTTNFEKMTKDESHLFEVDLDIDAFWNLYLDSFPTGTNNVFRKRREYDCSCCRNFIKNIGNVVVIKKNTKHTIWDINIGDEVFQPVFNAMSEYVKSKDITNVYISKFNKIGTNQNIEMSEGTLLTWDHFFLTLPSCFVNTSSASKEEVKGNYRDKRNVFKRSLDEITEDSISSVLELIAQNSLYKGNEWKVLITKFLEFKKLYDKTSEEQKDLFAWENSVKVHDSVGRLKNHSIGTLLINISEGMDLDLAVTKYEAITAPENYKRPKPIFTAKMLEDAKKLIIDLGYMDSLQGRRYATLDDITINNILFSNKDSVKRIIGGNLLDDMLKEAANINPKKFSKVEEVSIDDFIKNILPTTTEIEVLFENSFIRNMVSLITSENKTSKTMFKWNNNFSWAYTGNITDSSMKQNVKSAGGNVEGVLRFSIQWNDIKVDKNDLDAHCVEPKGFHIHFPLSQKRNPATTGQLDVDIRYPENNKPAVENITWLDKSKMQIGKYTFFVINYCHNGGRSGFRAEIEFDGQIFSFDYSKELKDSERVNVAEVFFDGNSFTMTEKLPSSTSSREIWGLKTNQFVPVSVLMLSPNYWDDQKEIGHKHYFFMLKDCINPESPNGIFNEFLTEDLLKHKKVFEAIGSKTAVAHCDDQLSGVGFSSTKRNEVLVKVKGQTDRVIKIKI